MTITDLEHGTELTDMAAVRIDGNDSILNSQGRDIESGELIVVPRERGKSNTWCCGLIRTPWQCVPACGACGGLTVALLGTIILVANQLLGQGDENQEVVTVDTILGAGLIVLGAVAVLTSCGSFCLIRHFKPEKDLEGQLDDFERENIKLKIENKGLKSNVERLEQILNGFKNLLEREKEITQKLEALFNERISALEFQRKELQLVVTNYEKKVTQGLKTFDTETKQAKELSEQLVNSNKALRERLEELDVNVDGLAQQEKEWEKDLVKLTTENDEFEKHNFELQRLGKILNGQLAVIKQLTDTLGSQQEGIKLQAERLDEFDDKLVDASSDLLKVVEQKNHELEEAKLRLAQLTEAMAKFRSAILELQKIDLKHVDSCEGLFKPLLKILDEVSDTSLDHDDSLMDD